DDFIVQVGAFICFQRRDGAYVAEALHSDGQRPIRMRQRGLHERIRAACKPAALFLQEIMQHITEGEVDALAGCFSSSKRAAVDDAFASKAAKVRVAGMD